MLTLLRCGDVRPYRFVLGYFRPLRVASVGGGLVGGLAARFVAAFLSLHFVYPPAMRLVRPLKKSGLNRLIVVKS